MILNGRNNFRQILAGSLSCLNVEIRNLIGSGCQALHVVIMDRIGVFNTDRPGMGDDKFRFERYHVAFGYYVAAAGRDDRELIDLDAYTVAYETGVLSVAHVISG